MSHLSQLVSESGEKRLFLLVRVPKSGSTSLSKMVSSALGDAHLFTLPDESKLSFGRNLDEVIRHALTRYKRLLLPYRTWSYAKALKVIGEQAKPGDIVSGHVSVDTVEIPGWKIEPITLIRDPYDRFLSYYNYSRVGYEKLDLVNRAVRRNHVKVAGTQGFDGFVDFMWERRAEVGNSATKMITGSASCQDPFAFVIDHYFHFGALERLDQFAKGLSHKLCIDAKETHANCTNRRAVSDFSAHARAKVEEMFDKDLELHEAVLRHVDEHTDAIS